MISSFLRGWMISSYSQSFRVNHTSAGKEKHSNTLSLNFYALYLLTVHLKAKVEIELSCSVWSLPSEFRAKFSVGK